MDLIGNATNPEKTVSEKMHVTWSIPNFLKMKKQEDLINNQFLNLSIGETIGLPTLWGCWLNVSQSEILFHFDLLKFCPNVETIPTSVVVTLPHSLKKYTKENTFKFEKVVGHQTGNLWTFPIMSSLGALPSTLKLSPTGSLELGIILTISKTMALPNLNLQAHVDNFAAVFKTKLSSDLEKMYGYPPQISSYPTKVRSKDGKEFPVNPGILSARSPVFQIIAQFQQNQGDSGALEIPEISAEPLDILLHFMHTGSLKGNWSNQEVIAELVYGANKYKQTDLLGFFDQTLALVCNSANAGKLAGLAKLLNLKKAETELIEYFKKNVKEVSEVVQFAKDAEYKWTTKPEMQVKQENTEYFDS